MHFPPDMEEFDYYKKNIMYDIWTILYKVNSFIVSLQWCQVNCD